MLITTGTRLALTTPSDDPHPPLPPRHYQTTTGPMSNTKNPRYEVVGYIEVQQAGSWMKRTVKVTEPAMNKEEANLLYDLMLEDEAMVQGVTVVDRSNGAVVRDSHDVNEQPL